MWEKAIRVVKNMSIRCMMFTLVLFSSCAPDVSDDAIPFIPFADFIVNLNLPEYAALKTDGGYKYINNDVGVRGVILYRKNANTYIAYERNSSYHPNEACATVEVHSTGLYMIDTCSNSIFDFITGNPTSGPAIRPLRQYATVLTTFELTITDDIVY